MTTTVTTSTPCRTRIDKYRSNWNIFVTSDEENVFQGQIHAGLDGMEEEDREEYERELEELANLGTVEEIEVFMNNSMIDWNCIAYDYR